MAGGARHQSPLLAGKSGCWRVGACGYARGSGGDLARSTSACANGRELLARLIENGDRACMVAAMTPLIRRKFFGGAL